MHAYQADFSREESSPYTFQHLLDLRGVEPKPVLPALLDTRLVQVRSTMLALSNANLGLAGNTTDERHQIDTNRNKEQ